MDVLGVMDDAAVLLGRDGYSAIPNDLAEARAAVAELIAKADTGEKLIRNVANAGQVGAGYLLHADDLRAALTRIGGAP
jgi:hypothetical protein